jgi:putative ABC transport system permease protein
MPTLIHDLRYAVRTLRKSPAFTLTAVAALALGIGANTAIFSVIDSVILRPLPFADSDRLVSMGRHGGGTVSIPMFSFWERHNPGFEDLAAYLPGASMNRNGETVRSWRRRCGPRGTTRRHPTLRPRGMGQSRGRPAGGQNTGRANGGQVRLFGAAPLMGRTFTDAEDRPGGARVLLLSYELWQRRFGGEPAILGQSLTLGGAAYTVVGVLSPGFVAYRGLTCGCRCRPTPAAPAPRTC